MPGPRPTTDKSQCRYCKLREPQVRIRLVKGLPVGECQECNRLKQLERRQLHNHSLGLYRALPSLMAQNTRTLETLQPGAYPLQLTTTKEQIGYIVIYSGMIYVNTWDIEYLFHRRLWEIGSFIGNMGLLVIPKLSPIVDSEGSPIAIDAIGSKLPLEDPSERLVWFNKVLMRKAEKRVKALEKSKRSIRRSKNPMRTNAPKPL